MKATKKASKRKSLYRKSLYGNGEFLTNMCRVRTVGELKELLAMLPDELPLESGGAGYKPIWFNIGFNDPGHSEHLELDHTDAWDDDEDDLEEDE